MVLKQATAPHFSPAEYETLQHVCNGLQNDEIAEVMGVSLNTVKPRLRLLMAKTETRSRLMLAITAVKNNWV